MVDIEYAIITLKKPKNGSKPGLISMQHNLQGYLQSQGIQDLSVRKIGNSLVVPIGINRKILESFIQKSDIPYNLDFRESSKPPIIKMESKTPHDYGALKGQVKDLNSKVSGLEAEVISLKEKNQEEKERVDERALEMEGLKKKYNSMSVNEFLAESILRERDKWTKFVKDYSSLIDTAQQAYSLNISEIESAVLNPNFLNQKKELGNLRNDYDAAIQARNALESNKFLTLDPKAKEVIRKVEELEKQQKIYVELNKELRSYVPSSPVNFGFQVSGDETKLILPFSNSGVYHLEKSLVEGIEDYLSQKAIETKKDSYKGLLIYDSTLKPRSRANLVNFVIDFEDAFSKLGGKRSVTKVESYSNK